MSHIKELKNISKDLSVLYVEDDTSLAQKTSEVLKNFFKESLIANDGEEGLEVYNGYFKEHNRYIDIVISDIRMPKKDGVELSREILSVNEEQCVVIFSAYDDSKQLIDLINTGVDHFMSKPIKSEDLIDILLKCCQKIKRVENSSFIDISEGFVWDKQDRVLKKEGEFIKITKNERIILDLFIKNPNQIFSDDMIFNAIYFDDASKDMSSDSIKSIIKRLRKKLPEGSIENIYGDGYKINLSK